MEFQQDDTAARDQEALVEMRLYVPDGPEAVVGEEGVETQASQLLKRILIKVGPVEGAGDAVAVPDMPFLPRGRYELELFTKYMRLHGKTYDYSRPGRAPPACPPGRGHGREACLLARARAQISSHVVRLFLLPKPGSQQVRSSSRWTRPSGRARRTPVPGDAVHEGG